jgi:hypothetical protein
MFHFRRHSVRHDQAFHRSINRSWSWSSRIGPSKTLGYSLSPSDERWTFTDRCRSPPFLPPGSGSEEMERSKRPAWDTKWKDSNDCFEDFPPNQFQCLWILGLKIVISTVGGLDLVNSTFVGQICGRLPEQSNVPLDRNRLIPALVWGCQWPK